MKKMFLQIVRECRIGAPVMAVAVVCAMVICAGCSQGRLHEVTEGDTRGGGADGSEQTGITVHVDTTWRDTIRVQF